MNKKTNFTIIISLLAALVLVTTCILAAVVPFYRSHPILPGRIVIQGTVPIPSNGPPQEALFTYDDWLYSINRITPDNMLAFSPAWSPNGKVIAFVYGDLQQSNFRIATMDVDTRKTGVILDKGISNFLIQYNTALAWSPDGEKLLFDLVARDNCHYLFVYALEEKTYQQTSIKFCQATTMSPIINSLDISWSPSNTPLIGVMYQDDSGALSEIYMADEALTGARFITNGFYPSWRPGASDFSYVAWTPPPDIPAICIYSTTRGPLGTLVQSFGHDKYAWSPDGHNILFVDTGSTWNSPTFLSVIDVRTQEKYNLLRLSPPPLDAVDLLFPRSWTWGEATWSVK